MSAEVPRLVEWDETRRVGRADARPSVAHGLVGDGKFPEVVAHHLGLDLDAVHGLACGRRPRQRERVQNTRSPMCSRVKIVQGLKHKVSTIEPQYSTTKHYLGTTYWKSFAVHSHNCVIEHKIMPSNVDRQQQRHNAYTVLYPPL